MEHADCSLQALVTEVRIEGRQVGGHHQALIDDGLVREAADVVIGIGGVGHRGATTRAEQLDGEVLVGQTGSADEHLLDLRQALQGQAAEDAGVDRHLAPADQLQAGGDDLAIHVLASGLGLHRILVEENHAHRVLLGQLDRKLFLGHCAQEQIRLLDQQAATVTRFPVRVDPTSVGHAGQRFDGCLQKFVTCLALHMGDQAESAVILERFRMVQTCFHRELSPAKLF
ncbi:hypothetical protein D3C76_645100 [compost metagenome]